MSISYFKQLLFKIIEKFLDKIVNKIRLITHHHLGHGTIKDFYEIYVLTRYSGGTTNWVFFFRPFVRAIDSWGLLRSNTRFSFTDISMFGTTRGRKCAIFFWFISLVISGAALSKKHNSFVVDILMWTLNHNCILFLHMISIFYNVIIFKICFQFFMNFGISRHLKFISWFISGEIQTNFNFDLDNKKFIRQD